MNDLTDSEQFSQFISLEFVKTYGAMNQQERERLGENNARASRIMNARPNKDAWTAAMYDIDLNVQQVISLFDLDRFGNKYPDITVPATICAGNETPSTLGAENMSFDKSVKTSDEQREEILEGPGTNLDDKYYLKCKVWMKIDLQAQPSEHQQRIMIIMSNAFANLSLAKAFDIINIIRC